MAILVYYVVKVYIKEYINKIILDKKFQILRIVFTKNFIKKQKFKILKRSIAIKRWKSIRIMIFGQMDYFKSLNIGND
jgi:hypothetical protein